MPLDTAHLEHKLNSFSPETRHQALTELAAAVASGGLPVTPLTGAVNTHLHTFYSYNYRNWSPERLAWEAKKLGVDVVGAVDFDVLDALPDWFSAGDLLSVRTCMSFETRVFVADYADREINSPGEPGVLYFMGTGFTTLPDADSPAAVKLNQLREQARARNLAMLDRLRASLAPLAVNYDRDIAPLSPNDNATERHMLEAFDLAARKYFTRPDELAAYWCDTLNLPLAEVTELLPDTAKFRTAIRARLMKRGGPGYVQPDADTFPPLDEVIQLVRDCGGVPTLAWLDGTSTGEADADAHIRYFAARGCPVLGFIPDRNWNIADPEIKRQKIANLEAIIQAARAHDLILAIGTEMNNYGQKFVDTFAAPELAPYIDDFRRGGYALYGATLMGRARGRGLCSAWDSGMFGEDRKAANAFFCAVGEQAASPIVALAILAELSESVTPDEVLAALR